MQPRPRLVLLGKQGAGKGTQAVRISEHYDVAHFSTGDLFRELARLETVCGAHGGHGAEEITGGKVGNAEVIAQARRLRSLPRSLLAEQHEARQRQGTGQLRNPS